MWTIDKKKMGMHLYKLIDKSGMSMEEVSQKSDISKNTLYNWAEGRHIPPLDKLVRHAYALEKPIQDLIVIDIT